jgi:plasmid stabilization system protein ParE
MLDSQILPIYYTDKAISGLIGIKEYLLKYFTQREVDRFYTMLRSFEKVVSVFPELYPVSAQNKVIHRAVLSKQLSVFYRASKSKISVIAIIDNRMDYSNWP